MKRENLIYRDGFILPIHRRALSIVDDVSPLSMAGEFRLYKTREKVPALLVAYVPCYPIDSEVRRCHAVVIQDMPYPAHKDAEERLLKEVRMELRNFPMEDLLAFLDKKIAKDYSGEGKSFLTMVRKYAGNKKSRLKRSADARKQWKGIRRYRKYNHDRLRYLR